MNKKMNDILDEAHRVYERTVKDSIDRATEEGILKDDHTEGYSVLSRESFINRIKTDSEFSEKWGLKIEERELSFKERNDYGINVLGYEGLLDFGHTQNDDDEILYCLNAWGVPTKLITITYNNETIESYE